MKKYSPNNTETSLTDTGSAAPQLHAEIDEMRRRLAALEARALAHANPTVGRKGHWRTTPKRLAFMIAGVMLIGATVVFGQSAIDSLFVNKDGNVGIGTSAPRARLDVSGGGVKIGATSDLIPVAGKELVLAPLSGTSTGINFQHNGIDSVFLRSDSASRSTSLGGNAGTFLTIDNRNGNVGLGTTAPNARLDVAGSGWFRNDQGVLPTSAGKGVRLFYDTNDSGQIFSYDYSINRSRNLLLQAPGGNVAIGNITPQAKLHVAGTLISQGRYQKDNAAETTYEVSPRYHLTLTPASYNGSTRQIPQQVIIDLCGDPDGCQFRLGMTRWSSNAETETASITGLLYYSTSDGHWRTSMLLQLGADAKNKEAVGVDGDKKTDHVVDAWGVCYFTDSPYSNYQDKSDPDIGMYLLVWKNDGLKWTNPGRTCELTLID